MEARRLTVIQLDRNPHPFCGSKLSMLISRDRRHISCWFPAGAPLSDCAVCYHGLHLIWKVVSIQTHHYTCMSFRNDYLNLSFKILTITHVRHSWFHQYWFINYWQTFCFFKMQFQYVESFFLLICLIIIDMEQMLDIVYK